MARLAIRTIHLDLSPERIIVRADGQMSTYEPVLHLMPSENTGWRRALIGSMRMALGGDPLTDQPAYSVPLFSGGAKLPAGLSKADCLERFFRLAFKRVMDSYVFRTKPRVEVRGLARLEPALAGYQEELLRGALKTAGAGAVYIVD
jgi:hypothetical protein